MRYGQQFTCGIIETANTGGNQFQRQTGPAKTGGNQVQQRPAAIRSSKDRRQSGPANTGSNQVEKIPAAIRSRNVIV